MSTEDVIGARICNKITRPLEYLADEAYSYI
jgi:hypothetical protein